MSRAFIREEDNQWLHDVAPTVSALLVYLARENNGIAVREERTYFDADGREVHVMSNGLAYVKSTEGTWQAADE